MTNHAEKYSNIAEMAHAEQHPMRAMFVRQLSQLHVARSDEALANGFGRKDLVRGAGETYFIDPRYGEGIYWFYLMNNNTIVASMDLTFNRCANAHTNTVPYVGFGLYEHAMPQYCSPACCAPCCKLMGFNWQGGPYCISIEPGKRMSSTSITIAPESVPHYAEILHCDTEAICNSVERLTASDGIPGLPSALRGLDVARPKAPIAEAYYHSKVIECLALLVSGTADDNDPADTVRTNDRSCVERACCYIDEHLTNDLGTKALCDIAHVSEGKLISAFRNVKGIPPQTYIRQQRLNHARILLLKSDCSIKEIAESAGYCNQGAFSDAFKRTYGMAPLAYRKSLLACPRCRPKSS